LAYIKECEEYGKPLNGNKIYQEFEEEHPHHSYHSWRDRWLQRLRLRQTDDAADEVPSRVVQAAKPVPCVVEEDKATQPSRRTDSTDKLADTGKDTVDAHQKPLQFTASHPPRRMLSADEQGESSKDGGVVNNSADAAEQELAPISEKEATLSNLTSSDTEVGRSKTGIFSTQQTAPDLRVVAPTKPVPTQLPASRFNGATGRMSHFGSTALSEPALSEPPAGLTKAEILRWKLRRIQAAEMAQRIWRGNMVRAAIRSFDHDLVDLQARAKGFITRHALLDEGRDALDGAWEPMVEASTTLIARQQEGRDNTQNFPEQIVKCTCGSSKKIGQLISCPTCRTLQHVACYYPGYEENIHDGVPHSCVACENTEIEDEMRDVIPDLNLNEGVPETQGDPLTHKQAFYTYLNGYMKGTGSKINYFPTIQGRTLDLWNLWHVVISLDGGRHPTARNWEDIAEQLGFDWIATPEVVIQVQDCFSNNLGEFERFLVGFEDTIELGDVVPESSLKPGFTEVEAESGPDSDLDGQVNGAPAGQKLPLEPDSDVEMREPELFDDGLPFRSSPPPIRGEKRAYQEDDAESVDLGMASDQEPRLNPIKAQSASGTKRARYDKASTIPSTPEGKTGVSGLQQPSQHRPVHSTRLEPSDNVDPIRYTGIPQASNVYTAPPTQRRAITGGPSQKVEVVLKSTAVKPRHNFPSLPNEEVVTSTGKPSPTSSQQESSSPVQVQRRSLPQSFKRPVTPPRAGPGPITTESRQSMPARSIGTAQPVVATAKARQSLPTMDKGKGKSIERPVHPRRVSLPRQAKSSSPAPVPPPLENSTTSLSTGKTQRRVEEMVQFFGTFYNSHTVADVVKGTSANRNLMNVVLDKVEEARKRGSSTDLHILTDDIPGYWRKKDDARLTLIDTFAKHDAEYPNAREKLQARKDHIKAKADLERRFGQDGIEKRRKFLRAYVK
jgi:hypothetical protein